MIAEKLLKELTLQEKAGLCSGLDSWHIKGVERLGIPSLMITDGPHGLRKCVGNETVKATCFPPACLSACSWNEDALFDEGQAIAEECIGEDVAMILGPGVNIKRSPLCGRNFEYFSEDPFLAGKLAASWIRGVEKKGVGTSLKHFAANSQERLRMCSNSVVDERALREIYLPAFEEAVKNGHPSSLMCSYNRIDGTYAAQNRHTLYEILRQEWGYKGFVMTDWGAMDDPIESLRSGLELEMPGPDAFNEKRIVDAVESGKLDVGVLDRAVELILEFVLSHKDNIASDYDSYAHHLLARRIAADSMVLLKNDDEALPLRRDQSILVVGAFAKRPRFQGGGSSRVNSSMVDSAYDFLVAKGFDVDYAQGYDPADGSTTDSLLEEALGKAEGKDRVVLFVGLPDLYESEGFDRKNLLLPAGMDELAERLTERNGNVVVVLSVGSPVVLPWREKAKAILLSYLAGEASGSAVADVLSGKVDPSGHLAETWPLRIEDTPCFGSYATDDLNVRYMESLLVGYRYYDYMGKDVEYPFGHGLSYTTFDYQITKVTLYVEKNTGEVEVRIRNTGKVSGSAVAELYIGKVGSSIFRPVRELKGFAKVHLEPGEAATVTIPLSPRSFAFYCTQRNEWVVEDGDYEIAVGDSSRNLVSRIVTAIKGESGLEAPGTAEYSKEKIERDGFTDEGFCSLFPQGVPLHDFSRFDMSSPVCSVIGSEEGSWLRQLLEKYEENYDGQPEMLPMMKAMALEMPLRNLPSFCGLDRNMLIELVESLNSK